MPTRAHERGKVMRVEITIQEALYNAEVAS